MQEELNAIGQHQVFGVLVELPKGRKPLPRHQIYKIKRNGAGNVQRIKASLVSEGNHQLEGIDYQATYVPTTRLGYVGLDLAIAAMYVLEIHPMYLYMAFLEVDFEIEIYTHPLQG
jgi:hypothetical protein